MANEAPKPAASVPEPDAGHIPMSEEMDRAKWTLPPPKIVGIALLIVAIVVTAVSWLARAKPGALGSIDQIFAVEQPDKNSVLVAVQFTVKNVEKKPLWIRNLKARLKTDQEFNDEAASAVDFERYFQAYPELRQHASEAMKAETRIEPGAQQSGTIIVGFPVPKEAFERRKSFSVILEAYDRRPLVITK